MKDCITWVGMDDAANKINVAAFCDHDTSPREEFVVMNDGAGLGRLVKKLKGMPGQVRCVYEAGVNGYHIQRALTQHGIWCDVAAPSLTPRRAGKRVKTDKRDAKDLAKLYRSGELTSITIPEKDQESLRDLIRAREDALENLQRARHRLNRFLLRRGLKYRTGKAWTKGHIEWIKGIRLEDTRAQMVLEEYWLSLQEESARLERFEHKIEELAQQPEYQKKVRVLMALRGVAVLTAMTVLAEAIDLRRFWSARAFMASIGVVPSEDSSGDKERRGSITKTGNSHLRRVLVESAWTYRPAVTLGKKIKQRREGLPAEVLEIARTADQRLHKRYWYLIGKGKDSRKAAVAVARELAGFIWAIGQVA
jgi:transposase